MTKISKILDHRIAGRNYRLEVRVTEIKQLRIYVYWSKAKIVAIRG